MHSPSCCAHRALATLAVLAGCGDAGPAPPLQATSVPDDARPVAPVAVRDSATRPNLLLIIIDTLRADHMSVYGYPRETTPEIARHFAEAQLFERAYSAASYTSGSVVSTLSGLYPPSHGVRDFYRRLSPDVRLLPDYLRELGYQTAAIVSNTVLTDEALGIGSRFDVYDDFVDERERYRDIYERRASRTTDAALRWLALEAKAEQAHFLLLHYVDPHAPYAAPESEAPRRFDHVGSREVPQEVEQGYQHLPGVGDVLEYVDRYDEEIAYADQEVGRFLDAYEAQGLLDVAILISDHGELLLERRPYFEHSPSIWNEVTRVPLLVRWPGGRARRISTPVSLVDLTPTLLAQLGMEPPAGLEGVRWDRRQAADELLVESWVSPRAPSLGARRWRAVVRGDRKWSFKPTDEGQVTALWVEHTDPRAAARGPAIRRQAPGELVDLLESAIGREYADPRALGHSLEGARPGPKPAPDLEPHQQRALRALGYAE